MLIPIGAPVLLTSQIFLQSDLNSLNALDEDSHVDHDVSESIKCISCNRERMLFAVLSSNNLSIFWSHPQMLLLNCRRPLKSIRENGHNVWLLWKPDSSSIVVSTSLNYLLFYKLNFAIDSRFYDVSNQTGFVLSGVPSIKLSFGPSVKISNRITCLVTLKEELVVCSADSYFYRFLWSGDLLHEYSSSLFKLPFYYDQLPSSKSEHVKNPSTGQSQGIYVVSLAYSSLLSGYGLVLSDGRAALMTSSSPHYHPDELMAIWAPGVKDAVICTINHKFKLLNVGCVNCDIVAYHLDDTTGCLAVTYRINARDCFESVSSNDPLPRYPTVMEWSPYCCTLAVAYSDGSVSGWSSFGARLWYFKGSRRDIDNRKKSSEKFLNFLNNRRQTLDRTIGDEIGNGTLKPEFRTPGSAVRFSPDESLSSQNIPATVEEIASISTTFSEHSIANFSERSSLMSTQDVAESNDLPINLFNHNLLSKINRTTLDWGPEGYQLWISNGCDLTLQKFTRPLQLDINSSSGYLALLSCDQIIISAQPVVRSSNPDDVSETDSMPLQPYWKCISIPEEYLDYGWPIRFCSLDQSNKIMCLAGSKGFACYKFATDKWRYFGSTNQEFDILITSGLFCWRNYLIACCYDVTQQTDELRFYDVIRSKHDRCSLAVALDSQVLLTTVKDDVIMIFDVDSRCIIFEMFLDLDQKSEKIRIEKYAEIMVRDIVGHPACMISINLLFRGSEEVVPTFCEDVDTVLLNVSGRLIMLSPQNKKQRLASKEYTVAHALDQPVLVASFVENVWVDSHPSPVKPHLSRALWIACGLRGMRVWLPLFPKEPQDAKNRSFLSKRIMLPFELASMYPIMVISIECLIVGIDTSNAETIGTDCNVQKKSEVFLHHVLRQLLRRNLGLYALEIAKTIMDLPYFSHVLELLLHMVLEEEATSSEPIPDPLLPRVVAFLQEFHEFLQIVAHCARKTEMALWKHLFQTVGNPKDLFDVCLRDNHLDTAASYFLILQNTEPSCKAIQQAQILLNACLEKGRWNTAKDLIRLLRSIDPSDLATIAETSTLSKQHHHSVRMQSLGSINVSPVDDVDKFSYPLLINASHRQRLSSTTNVAPVSPKELSDGEKIEKKQTGIKKPAISKVKSDESKVENLTELVNSTRSSSFSGAKTDVAYQIHRSLQEYAKKLLKDGKLYEFNRFASFFDYDNTISNNDTNSSIDSKAFERMNSTKLPTSIVKEQNGKLIERDIGEIKISERKISLPGSSMISKSNSIITFAKPVDAQPLSVGYKYYGIGENEIGANDMDNCETLNCDNKHFVVVDESQMNNISSNYIPNKSQLKVNNTDRPVVAVYNDVFVTSSTVDHESHSQDSVDFLISATTPSSSESGCVVS